MSNTSSFSNIFPSQNTSNSDFLYDSIDSFLNCDYDISLCQAILDNSDWPFFQQVNIPDIIRDCSSFHDFLNTISYISLFYNTHQFFIDYIQFLENILCSLDFSSQILFQTFLDFQLSKNLYELNQLCYIFNTSFNTSKSFLIQSFGYPSESESSSSQVFDALLSSSLYCPFSGI